jgi:beta-galactosidase GanA
MSFIFGTQYYRYPNPPKEDWSKDLKNIKEYGLKYIKIWFLWNENEPQEGTFNFVAQHELFDLAEKNNLKVIAQIILETAPYWAFEKYPNERYVDQNGVPIGPEHPFEFPGGWPGLCYDSPIARSLAEKFMRKVAEEFKDHPALFAWDIWNEPLNEPARAFLFHVEGPYPIIRKFCYCKNTIAKFRDFLRKKYVSIENLNKTWGSTYSTWQEIIPPRIPRVRYGPWIDWRVFISENMAEKMNWRKNTIKSIDNTHIIVSHSSSSSTYYANPEFWEGCDDWKLAQHVDIYGCSFYIANQDPAERMQVFDGIRSSCRGKPFWVGEMQNSPAGCFLVSPVRDEDLWLSWLASLACGSSGLIFWQWRNERWGPEAPYFGCTKTNGTPNRRTTRIRRFSSLLNKIGDDIIKYNVPVYTAIYYDPRIFHYCWAGINSIWSFNFPTYRELYKDCISGAYKILWDLDIQTKFIHAEFLEDKDLVGISTLIMPFPVFIEKKTAGILKEFVRSGGILIAEIPLAQAEDGYIAGTEIPGSGLSELFSVQTEPMILQNTEIRIKDKRIQGLTKTIIEPLKAEVIGQYLDGSPGALINNYGKGKAILIGTTFTYSYNRERSNLVRDFLKYYVKGSIKTSSTNPTKTSIRILYGYDNDLLFILNFSDNMEEITIRFEKEYSSAINIETNEKDIIIDGKLYKKMRPNSGLVLKLS